MAYEGQGIDISLPAAADLSSYQYRFVAIDSNGRGTLSGANGTAGIGILQNKPGTADRAMSVRIGGIGKLVFGAAAEEGAPLCSGISGCGTVAASLNDHVLAIALHGVGGSGDIQDVLLVNYWKPA